MSYEMRTEMGVGESSVFSQLLYITHQDVAMRKVSKRVCKYGEGMMAYSDDFSCWSEYIERFREVMTCYQVNSKKLY